MVSWSLWPHYATLHCSSVLLDEVADGALDDVDALHHLRLGDDQRRCKPDRNIRCGYYG